VAEPLPQKVARKLHRGDSRTWTHVFTDTDTGVPLDITGWAFLSQFREDLNRGTVVCEATCVIDDGPNGVMIETLSPTQAELLPGQADPTEKPTVYWDLQSTDDNGNVRTWMFSTIAVTGDVSDE